MSGQMAIAGESDSYGGFVSMADEFDRLRAEVERLMSIKELEAENARLRALAEELADVLSTHFGSTDLVKRARSTLEQKAGKE